ncbi:YALIA101S05e15368g1_1 [Yarrowia lipolytica]|nr:hypothetical protein YALI1_E18326g [Yarrowia lipolytica]QNP98992.1 Mitochondrial 37S ribosomal protein S27 [Yarrowia lipolytica]SEI34985.1 YALIA101S05e15368g1_1 [Yarrowia lipolytica]VBB78686.1 Mitochondrial ribosomal protein of the small subunit, putative [Yarrowia lipolytica]
MNPIRPSKERLTSLAKLTAQVFNRSYNPENLRRGTKALRAPLIGEQIKSYYPTSDFSMKSLREAMPQFGFADYTEWYRLTNVVQRKKRGKGAPKKLTEKKAAGGKKKK